MLYFGRHPNQYGTKVDRCLITRIEKIFCDSVKTPDYKVYNETEQMFDVLYECDAGVFRPFKDDVIDKVTISHMMIMSSLGKPVYLIHPDGSIIKQEKKP